MKHIFIVLCLLIIPLTSAYAEVSYSRRDRTLSVTSEGQNLVEILYEIMEKTGIQIEIEEGVAGTVYDNFQGLGIENSIRRILKTQNYSFVYRSGSIKKIYVFPPGTSSTPETVPSSPLMRPVPGLR